MDWHKVSKTGDCRKLLGQPYGGNASSMTIRSMFTLICCSLAGLKISLRTGLCCRNVLVQDKIKVHRKLYLSLPHIGHQEVPSQIACFICSFGMEPCYRRQYWMASSHLQIFYTLSPANFSPASWNGAFSPAFFFWQIFHMQFWDGTVQSCQIPAKKKNNQWNHGINVS